MSRLSQLIRDAGMGNREFPTGYPRIRQWVILDGKTVAITKNLVNLKTVEVHIVDGEGFGGWVVKVNVKRLKPLLDKRRIPEKRRATMDPKWEPQP